MTVRFFMTCRLAVGGIFEILKCGGKKTTTTKHCCKYHTLSIMGLLREIFLDNLIEKQNALLTAWCKSSTENFLGVPSVQGTVIESYDVFQKSCVTVGFTNPLECPWTDFTFIHLHYLEYIVPALENKLILYSVDEVTSYHHLYKLLEDFIISLHNLLEYMYSF